MHIALLLLYGFLCIYTVGRLSIARKSGIRPSVVRLLFVLHIAVGLLHNAIAWRYFYGHGDIWDYFDKSILYRHRLLSQFGLWISDNSSWTHITHNGIIYINMLLNVISFNDFTTNTLLFSFPVFIGNLALFRFFRHRFPNDPLTAFMVFFLPSVLFWTSCIYREAVLYMLLSILLSGLNRLLVRRFSWPQLGYVLVVYILIAYFRGVFALTLFPAIYVWVLVEKRKIRRQLLIGGLVALVLGGILILSEGSIPEAIATRQQEFREIGGHSLLSLPVAEPTWGGLVKIIPAATLNGLFQPLPGFGGNIMYLAFSLELLAVWTIVIFAIIRSVRYRSHIYTLNKAPIHSAFGLFCLIFSLSGMLIIGAIVPYAGAIVRYRSIYLLFLLAPCLHSLGRLPFFQIINERLSRCLSHRL
jgi:hypothetical protein